MTPLINKHLDLLLALVLLGVCCPVSSNPRYTCSLSTSGCDQVSSFIRHFSQLDQFCVAMSYPGAQNCYISVNPHCSQAEVTRLKVKSCRGIRHFYRKVNELPKDCKDRIATCLNVVPEFQRLFYKRKHCAAMTYLDESDNEVNFNCLVRAPYRAKCKLDEFTALKQAACHASSRVVSFVMLIVSGLFYIILQF